MHITGRQTGKAVVLSIAGRLDGTSAQHFRDALLPLVKAAAGVGHSIVLDFTDVEHISSGGERVLMLALKETNAAGTKLVVAAMQPLVKEIFQISRFDRILPCYADVNEALASL